MKFKGIALSGKMRTGKDTTAGMIASKDSTYQRFAFADELKYLATEKTGLSFFKDEVKTEHRKFLIMLGQAFREFDPLYWVKTALRRIENEYSMNPSIIPIISDLRFKNEARALKNRGFMLIRLNTPEDIILERGGTILDDSSETELDSFGDWDLVIDTHTMTPSRVRDLVMQVFEKSNKDEALIEDLMERPSAEVAEIVRSLFHEGKVTIQDVS